MIIKVSFVIAIIAGMESTAKTISDDSINKNVRNVVVKNVFPFVFIKNFLPL